MCMVFVLRTKVGISFVLAKDYGHFVKNSEQIEGQKDKYYENA